jgi:hypothetical protein
LMSYEDIEDARGERAAKKAAKEAAAVKGVCGWKRKIPAPEAAKAKKARRSEAEVAEDEIAASGMGNYCSVLQLGDGSL